MSLALTARRPATTSRCCTALTTPLIQFSPAVCTCHCLRTTHSRLIHPQAGDDKRLLQAASRRKKLDRIGCDKTADGKKFKVSYWAGYHETQRPQVGAHSGSGGHGVLGAGPAVERRAPCACDACGTVRYQGSMVRYTCTKSGRTHLCMGHKLG